MYILCCGQVPFHSENNRDFTASMRYRIKQGAYDFKAREWSMVSVEAKKLVRNMLQVNPAIRFSIEQVMQSDWMQVRYRYSFFK